MDVQPLSGGAAATDATKTALENSVNWFLADKLQGTTAMIATKKYLTTDNTLVYLTYCSVAESNVPKIKVQVLNRVDGGVREVGYQLFSDHRLVKYTNEMIFGTQPGTADGTQFQEVGEPEAQSVLAQVNALANARPTL